MLDLPFRARAGTPGTSSKGVSDHSVTYAESLRLPWRWVGAGGTEVEVGGQVSVLYDTWSFKLLTEIISGSSLKLFSR